MSLNDIDAANTVAVNEGDAGGHVNVLDAYNATGVIMGEGGGHLNEQDAINEIAVGLGGINTLNLLDGLHEILLQRGDVTVYENIRDALDAWALTAFLANTVFPTKAKGFVVGSKAKDVATNNGVALGTLATKDAGDFAGTDDFALPSTIARADDVAWQLAGWMVFDDFVAPRPLCGDATSKLTLTNATTVTLTNSAGGSVTWTISALSTATKYRFVLTCDGSDSSNFELFINDVSEGTKTLADSSFDVDTIGQAGGANHLGEITGVGFWSAVLSVAQNTELWNSGTPLPHASWSAGIDTNLTEIYEFVPLPDPWTVGNAQIDWTTDQLRAFTYLDANQRLVCQTTKPADLADTFTIKDKDGVAFARAAGRSVYIPFNKIGDISYNGWSAGTGISTQVGIEKRPSEQLGGRNTVNIVFTDSNAVDELDPVQFLHVLQSTGGFVFAHRQEGQLPQFVWSEFTLSGATLNGLIGPRDTAPGPIEVGDILFDDLLAPFNTDAAYWDHDEAAPADDSERELANGAMLCAFTWDANTGVDAAVIAFHYVDASNYIEVRGEADGSVVLRTRVAAANTDDTLAAAATLTDGETVYIVLHGAHVTVYGVTAGFIGAAYTDEITAAMLAEATCRITEMSNASLTNLKIGKIYPIGAARTQLARLMTVTKNLPPLTGLLSLVGCIKPFWGGEEVLDWASILPGTHIDVDIPLSLGIDFVASTDGPTYVANPGGLSVGLDFISGDHCRYLFTKTLTGDFDIKFCVRFDSLVNERLLTGNAGDDFIEVVDSTTLRVRIAGVNHDFTIAALGTSLYNKIAVKREGTNLQARVNGVTNMTITGVSADTFATDDIGSDNAPAGFIDAKLAGWQLRQATVTDSEMDAEETTFEGFIKDIHQLPNSAFA